MRSLHPKPYSRFDSKIERAAEGLNSLCLYMIPIAVFSWLILGSQPYEAKTVKHTRPAVEQQVGDISEMDYLMAISAAKTVKGKLSPAEIAEMDMWASKATNPADIDRMKPKAKAAYYASLNKQQSLWSVVE